MKSIECDIFGRVFSNLENDSMKFILFRLESYQDQPVVSLHMATQKLAGFIQNISDDLLIAKGRGRKVPMDNMSEDESAAIYLYTMSGKSTNQSLYEGLNSALRAKTQALIGPYVPYLKLLTTALSKIDSISQVVYRGINADLSEKYPIGKTFVWSTFR